MAGIRVGIQLHPQHTTYQEYAEAVRAVEALGVDTIWTWDHFFPLYGDRDGAHFEGWTLLTAMATLTQRAELGCMVTCNSYRNPNLLADMARTVDHISGGRVILGIGAGWFARDYEEYGYAFGTASDRLRALREALPIITGRWQQLNPRPVRHPIPILIGGGGEKVTLRLTAQYASLWNGFGPPSSYRHKNDVLDEWCQKLGRDPRSIERSVNTRNRDPQEWDDLAAAGAQHLILELGATFDRQAVKTLVAWRESSA
jgi:probable F420-dependent oxidoreductase